MRRALVLVAALAAAVAMTACGSSGGSGAAVSSGPAPAQEPTVSAEHVLLTPADLSGYDVGSAATTPAAASGAAASTFESCAGADGTLSGTSPTAQSPAFFKGQTVLVSSLATVAATDAEARTALGQLGKARLAGCFTGLFRTVLGLDQVPGTSATTEAVAGPNIGDQSITWRTTIQVSSQGQKVAAYSDLTFVRTGRTVAALFTVEVGQPFPADERVRLVQTMAARGVTP